MKKIVVTGIGIVSSAGIGKEKFTYALKEGVCGIKENKLFYVPNKRKTAGTIEEFPYNKPGRASQILRKAIKEAIDDSKINIPEENNYALLMGSMAGDTQTAEELFCGLDNNTNKTPRKVKMSLIKYQMSSLIDNLSYRFGLKGPRMVASNACASSNIILGYGLDLIRNGNTDVVIACGIDVLKETMFWGAEGIKILGPELKAFDKERKGTVLGEGAGVLILEDEKSAKERGAHIYAELAGYGISCDSKIDMIIPEEDGAGLARAIENTLLDANLEKNQVNYVNAHGTGTINIDKVETLALKKIFGEDAYNVPMSSTKTIVGHTSGAGGIIESIATIIAIDKEFYPPTLNYKNPDPQLDLDYVVNKSREGKITSAISNNMGGGGVNSVVAFAKAGLVRESPNENTSEERVVVSGLGVISPIGNGIDSFIENYENNRLSLKNDKTVKVNNFDIENMFPNKKYQATNVAGQYVLGSAMQAYKDAKLNEIDRQRVGVLVGTTFGGYTTTTFQLCDKLKNQGPNYITPYFLLNSGHNLGASLIARECNVEGMYSTITTGITAGIDAIGYAMNLIRTGRMDAIIVGAVDILDNQVFEAYSYIGMYDNPNFFLSEGAGVIVLESLSSAKKRKSHIYGEAVGYSSVGDTVGRGKLNTTGTTQMFNIKNLLSKNESEAKNNYIYSHNFYGNLDFLDNKKHEKMELKLGEAHAAVSMFSTIKALGDNSDGNVIVCASAPGGINSAVHFIKNPKI
ncbi:MAG: beta-ketoacyl synthase N-terminal-like domain-containing protein [Clostridiaceae bacterium]